MTNGTKAKSRILQAVHDTAGDLRRLGFIDKRKMRKYDALCLDRVREYDAGKVQAVLSEARPANGPSRGSSLPPRDGDER